MPRTPEPTFLESIVYRRPPYFWWFLALILAVCFTVLSWTLCYTIFNNPEVPRHYEIMRKLDRLPVHTNYSETTQPKFSTSTAPKLRNKFLSLSEQEIAIINRSLMNSYLTNFSESTFCSYLKGRFKVIDARKLNKDDFISQGFAVKLQAYTQVDEYTDPTPYPVIAEIIFSTPYSGSFEAYFSGDIIELNITPYFASVLHAETIVREDDDTIVVITAISLGSKIRPPHAGPFDLAPPSEVNLEGKTPLFP